MKRHDALVPLSREHQEALLLALILQKNAPVLKNMPSETQEKAGFALKLFRHKLQPHFIREEKMLDMTADIHSDIDRLTAEIKNEHLQLAAMFESLNKEINSDEELDLLGLALDQHIRKEERQLFPLIQQHCSEELLNSFHLE
jgi:hemerythrin-like domain-containing protein